MIMPLLALLLLGAIEFGRIFSAGLIVTHSAREGARVGAIGATDTSIISRVQNTAAGLDPAILIVGITPGLSGRERGTDITVRVDYPVTVITPLMAAITGGVVTVHGESTMRVE